MNAEAILNISDDLRRIERKLDRVLFALGVIYTKEIQMSKNIDAALSDLNAEISNLQSVDASAVAALNAIPKIVEDAIASATDDSAAVTAVRDAIAKVKANNSALAAAVVANTPAAQTSPATPPADAQTPPADDGSAPPTTPAT